VDAGLVMSAGWEDATLGMRPGQAAIADSRAKVAMPWTRQVRFERMRRKPEQAKKRLSRQIGEAGAEANVVGQTDVKLDLFFELNLRQRKTAQQTEAAGGPFWVDGGC